MADLTGQITVLQTSTQGPDAEGVLFIIKPHPSNTATVWFGNTRDAVTSGVGYPIVNGDSPIIIGRISNLNQLFFLSGTAGQKICWLIAE